MAQVDVTYNNLLSSILKWGYVYRTENRPNIDCRQLSSVNMEITLETFPLLTTKEMYWKGVVAELIWFLRGDDNIKYLLDNNVNIWNKDAYKYYLRISERVLGKDEFTYPFDEWLEHCKNPPKYPAIAGSGYKFGDVGRNYGVQWRRWTSLKEVESEDGEPKYVIEELDQVSELFRGLNRANPINRRHIVTSWNPAEKDMTALPPCHWAWEVIPRPLSMADRIDLCSADDQEPLNELWKAMTNGDENAKDKLQKSLKDIPRYTFTLKWDQRSVDTFLGLPFNIASYALLSHIVGELTAMMPLEIIGDLSNVHIYGPHNEGVKEQLARNPLEYPGCYLDFSERFLEDAKLFRKNKLSFDKLVKRLEISDFELVNYNSFGKLSAEMFEPTE